jgi:hypothetical protein
METIVTLFKLVYVYCTDFLINISNIFGISYYETNLFIFCFVYPFLSAFLPLIYMTLRIKKTEKKR